MRVRSFYRIKIRPHSKTAKLDACSFICTTSSIESSTSLLSGIKLFAQAKPVWQVRVLRERRHVSRVGSDEIIESASITNARQKQYSRTDRKLTPSRYWKAQVSQHVALNETLKKKKKNRKRVFFTRPHAFNRHSKQSKMAEEII